MIGALVLAIALQTATPVDGREAADALIDYDAKAAAIAMEPSIARATNSRPFIAAADRALLAVARLRTGGSDVASLRAAVADARATATPADRERLAILLTWLADADATLSPAARRALLEEAVGMVGTTPSTVGGRALANAADQSITLGDGEAAIALSRRAVAAFDTPGGGARLIDALGIAGDAELRHGSSETGVALLQRAATLADATPAAPPVVVARAYQNLGRHYGGTGRETLALSLFARAIAMLGDGQPQMTSDLYFDASQAASAGGDNDRARSEARLAIDWARRIGQPGSTLRRALNIYARQSQSAGDNPAATAAIDEAIAIARATMAADDPRQGEVLAVAAIIADGSGDRATAVAHCDAALQAMRSLRPAHRTLMSARVYCARYHLKAEDPRGAVTLSRAAADTQTMLLVDAARQPGATIPGSTSTVFDIALDSAWAGRPMLPR